MTERWLVLTVRSPSDELTPLLAEGLVTLSGNAVLEEGDLLSTSVAATASERDTLLARARDALSAIAGTRLEVGAEWRAAEDWSEQWRRGLAPRRVGERLVVTPSWCSPDSRPGDVVLVIDPEMAFGTGEHATTRGALRLLERVLTPGADVLDIGTGSGILAIAAALLGARRVDAPELDADALPYARANVARHGVTDRIDLEHAAVDAAYLDMRAATYDVITANLLSGVLRPLLPAMHRALRPDGVMILGGILADEADGMTAAAREARLALRAEDREDEWWTALFARHSS
ncbi:MAG: 50S ribosomal protein L11 methyltransferase [Longimicrobiales bacterium]